MSAATASHLTADIITVPDFSNTRRVAFALRTLFFQASWEAFAPEARKNCRLHIACIGEPPAAVRALADEVGAKIHVFEPLSIGRCKSVNKLRGLEISPESRISDRFLLLDTDVFFVSDPTPHITDFSTDTIAALPAMNKALPEYYWQRIYKALNLPDPRDDERIPMLSVELGLYEGPVVKGRGTRAVDLSAMRPYWNSGVLLCPWRAPLRERWAHDLKTIFTVFAPPKNVLEKAWFVLTDHTRIKPKAVVSNSDQAGLATAIQGLLALDSGYSFKRLPAALHSHSFHFRAGVLRFEDASIWHGTAFGKGVDQWADAKAHVEQYGIQFDNIFDLAAKQRGESSAPSTAVQKFMKQLWNRVEPIVQKHPLY